MNSPDLQLSNRAATPGLLEVPNNHSRNIAKLLTKTDIVRIRED